MKLAALFLYWIFCRASSSPTSDILHGGSSLSVETPNNILISPDGVFLAGFFPVGENAYCFAVWFNDQDNRTAVWMANRDVPVNGKQSKLSLLSNGDLILSDAGGATVWSTNTVSTTPSQLKLLSTGNLELRNSDNVLLWQSFDFPTDTILPLQPLTKTTTVVSSRSGTNFSSGFYRLFFDSTNILCLLFESPEVSSIYWPDPDLISWEAGRLTYNNTRIAMLDLHGNFTSTDQLQFVSADFGTAYRRRLKLDYDGNVRLYSRKVGSTGKWEVSWQAFSDPCQIHGSCGPNSICSYLASHGRNCSCIPGYKMKDHTDWSLGCVPEFDLSCSKSHQDDAGFLKLTHVDFYGYDMVYLPSSSLAECKNLCASSCDCKGFQFRIKQYNQFSCFAKSLLVNGFRSTNFPGNLYLKVPKGNLSRLHNVPAEFSHQKCPTKPNIVPLHRLYHVNRHNDNPLQFTLWFTIAIAILEPFIFSVIWCVLFIRTRLDPVVRQGYHLSGFRKFSYAELVRATDGFKEEIGRGAASIVYKGVLSDKRIAAIKRLVDADQGEAEFIAELSTIGRLNHMNLTEIWGYCVEGKHKLLVFEYMTHGSLAKNLKAKTLDWTQRLEIAIGTAKGLAYLHEECLEWVLHCDVKPQNILLDSEFLPKVSDFGLSLLNKEGSNSKISKMRGTRGYMAPEWILNQPITSKVDVYSYGMVLLEIVTGRNISHGEDDRNEAETMTLARWVRERMVEETATKEEKLKKIVDRVVDGEYEIDEMEVLVSVALRCVKEDKDERPTMGQVVEMLLGPTDHQLS